jgi:hypothetical protein
MQVKICCFFIFANFKNNLYGFHFFDIYLNYGKT